LVFRGEGKSFKLIRDLNRVSKKVLVRDVYRAVFREPGEVARMKAFIYGGAIDEIMLYSPEDFEALKNILEENRFSSISEIVKISSQNETILNSIAEITY
jgi:uroporphyrinogen-III synthase